MTASACSPAERGLHVAVLALMVLSVGCGPKAPDYQSIWNSSTTAPTSSTATAPTKPVPIAQYLGDVGVSAEQVAPDVLTDLTVSIPTPPGWEQRNDPDFPPGTEIIGKGSPYPKAILMVFKLDGDFDAAEAVKHGYTEAEMSKNFNRLDASTADFRGFPSAMIQGSYDLNGTRLHSWNRIVIATGSPPAHQRYLVHLIITTLANQAFAQSDDVEAIIRGFTVAAK